MNFVDGLYKQATVLNALILRETRTRFGKYQAGYLWAFLEPALWIGTFYGMFFLGGREAPDGMSILSFIASGLIPFQMFRDTTGRVASAVDGNKALLFYPQVRPLDLVLARTALEGVTWITVLLVLLMVDSALYGTFQLQDPLLLMLACSLGLVLGGAIGTMIGALTVFSASVGKVAPAVMRPLFWISGIFFTANSLPAQVRDYLLFNPVLHIVELTRTAIFASYESRYADPAYVVGIVIGCCAVALMLERVARRHLEVV